MELTWVKDTCRSVFVHLRIFEITLFSFGRPHTNYKYGKSAEFYDNRYIQIFASFSSKNLFVEKFCNSHNFVCRQQPSSFAEYFQLICIILLLRFTHIRNDIKYLQRSGSLHKIKFNCKMPHRKLWSNFIFGERFYYTVYAKVYSTMYGLQSKHSKWTNKKSIKCRR